jgi:hypothetical protein
VKPWGIGGDDCGFGIADFGLRIWDCGFRISDCGFGIADLGLRIWDCGLRIADFGLRIADFGFEMWDVRFGNLYSGLWNSLTENSRLTADS